MDHIPDKLSDDKLEEIRAGIEGLQQDQARRNVEEEIVRRGMDPGQVFTQQEKDAIKQLVHDALVEFFKSYGLKGKNGIIAFGLVLSSIVAAVIAIKTIGGWIGIGFINR